MTNACSQWPMSTATLAQEPSRALVCIEDHSCYTGAGCSLSPEAMLSVGSVKGRPSTSSQCRSCRNFSARQGLVSDSALSSSILRWRMQRSNGGFGKHGSQTSASCGGLDRHPRSRSAVALSKPPWNRYSTTEAEVGGQHQVQACACRCGSCYLQVRLLRVLVFLVLRYSYHFVVGGRPNSVSGYAIGLCNSKSILDCSDPAKQSSLLTSFPLVCITILRFRR